MAALPFHNIVLDEKVERQRQVFDPVHQIAQQLLILRTLGPLGISRSGFLVFIPQPDGKKLVGEVIRPIESFQMFLRSIKAIRLLFAETARQANPKLYFLTGQRVKAVGLERTQRTFCRGQGYRRE